MGEEDVEEEIKIVFECGKVSASQRGFYSSDQQKHFTCIWTPQAMRKYGARFNPIFSFLVTSNATGVSLEHKRNFL
jgi:hypothetical protein